MLDLELGMSEVKKPELPCLDNGLEAGALLAPDGEDGGTALLPAGGAGGAGRAGGAEEAGGATMGRAAIGGWPVGGMFDAAAG
jgi:hypothetical protein